MTAPTLAEVLDRILAPWVLDDLLRDFDGARRRYVDRHHGGSWGDRGAWFQVERDGIHIREHLAAGDIVAYTWRQVRDRIDQVPADAAATLHDAVEAERVHHRTFPMFAASPAAQGCGRVHGEGPQTYAQHLHDIEYDAHRERLDAYYETGRPLRNAAETARRDALLASNDVQMDLFGAEIDALLAGNHGHGEVTRPIRYHASASP